MAHGQAFQYSSLFMQTHACPAIYAYCHLFRLRTPLYKACFDSLIVSSAAVQPLLISVNPPETVPLLSLLFAHLAFPKREVKEATGQAPFSSCQSLFRLLTCEKKFILTMPFVFSYFFLDRHLELLQAHLVTQCFPLVSLAFSPGLYLLHRTRRQSGSRLRAT